MDSRNRGISSGSSMPYRSRRGGKEGGRGRRGRGEGQKGERRGEKRHTTYTGIRGIC
jgi:hypothetical protein